MSIILSLAGDGFADDLLPRQGYRQVARISERRYVPFAPLQAASRRDEYC
jgi:hypothetical protein